MSKKKRDFILWAEGGVVSFGEVTNATDHKVINPCVISFGRRTENYTDSDGLQKERHLLDTQLFPYAYSVVYDSKNPPEWTISPTATILDQGVTFNSGLIEQYDGAVFSTQKKEK